MPSKEDFGGGDGLFAHDLTFPPPFGLSGGVGPVAELVSVRETDVYAAYIERDGHVLLD